MHGAKRTTENCTQRKISNAFSSPKSITCAEIVAVWERRELIHFQQQNLKGRENMCYLRVDERIISKQFSQKWNVDVK